MTSFFSKVRLRNIVLACTIVIIAFLAFLVRILPLKYGAFLSEFDPYWHYYVTKRVVEDGFFSVFGWVDTRTWYPFGRPVAQSTPLGLPFTVAVFYLLLNGILEAAGTSLSLLDFAIFFPPVMAALTSVAVYFLGREIAGREAGLLAALLMALNNAYISRTSLGFLKHETIGILSIVLLAFLFLKALKSTDSPRRTLFYSVLAGLTLTYLNISWGASFYAVGLIPLFAIALVVVKRYSNQLLQCYSITMGLGILLMLPHPRTGPEILESALLMPVIAGFLILAAAEVLAKTRTVLQGFIPLLLVIVIGGGMLGLSLSPFGLTLAGKFAAVLNPALRTGAEAAIVESVAEHRMSTWSMFYLEFGSMLIFALIGLVAAIKRHRDSDVFIIVAALSSLYFASSFVRLTLVMAPMFAVLAGYGFYELSKPFAGLIRRASSTTGWRSRVSLVSHVGIIFILVLALILVPTFIKAVESADAPVTIASSSAPLRQYRGDWLEALDWIDKNIPKGEPVLAWWDYGYWISIGGNSTSLADNATLNTTQIALIGKILLSPEPIAIDLAKRHFNARYFLVYITTAPTSRGAMPWGFGDEGKWIYMANIASGFHPEINQTTVDKDKNQLPDDDTLLGKTILYAIGRDANLTKSEVAFVSASHKLIQTREVTTQVIILKAKT